MSIVQTLRRMHRPTRVIDTEDLAFGREEQRHYQYEVGVCRVINPCLPMIVIEAGRRNRVEPIVS